MIKINLLPLDQRQSKWPINTLLLGVGVLVMILCSSFYGYSLFKVWSLEKDLQITRNHYQALQPTLVMMTSANNKELQFNKKNNIVMSLTKERQSWYNIIQNLTAQTSPQIWFTDLIKSDKGGIQIRGWAATYPLVAEFMQTMENSQFFTGLTLNSVEKDPMTQATKFDIVIKPRGL